MFNLSKNELQLMVPWKRDWIKNACNVIFERDTRTFHPNYSCVIVLIFIIICFHHDKENSYHHQKKNENTTILAWYHQFDVSFSLFIYFQCTSINETVYSRRLYTYRINFSFLSAPQKRKKFRCPKRDPRYIFTWHFVTEGKKSKHNNKWAHKMWICV